MEHHSNKPPGALRLDYRPIDVTLWFSGQKNVAMPLCVEAAKTMESLRERSVSDFKPHSARFLAIVDQFSFGSFGKRHVPRAIPPAIFRITKGQRAMNVCPRRGAKEITQGGPDARLGLTIPSNL